MNKVFKLVIVKEWHPKITNIVIAKDEEEARQLCYISSNNYDVWLSDDDCIVTEIDLSRSGVIELNTIGNPIG